MESVVIEEDIEKSADHNAVTHTGINIAVYGRAYSSWLLGKSAHMDDLPDEDVAQVAKDFEKTGTIIVSDWGSSTKSLAEIRARVERDIHMETQASKARAWLHIEKTGGIYSVHSDLRGVLLHPQDNLTNAKEIQKRLAQALNVLLNPRSDSALDFDIIRYFEENNGERLRQYVDGDFWHDMIQELGGKKKNHTPDITRLLHHYLTRIWLFEKSPTPALALKALYQLGSLHYKYGKGVEVGGVKLASGVDEKLYADEETAITKMNSNDYKFLVPPPNQLTGVDEFIRGVLSEGLTPLDDGKRPFYIYPKIWQGLENHWTILVGRDGRLEPYYTSNTYSEVAGQRQWQRHEGVMAYFDWLKRLLFTWYMKPNAEHAHELPADVSNAINAALAEAIARGWLVPPAVDQTPDMDALGLLFVKIGAAFGLSGEALSLDEWERPRNGNPRKFHFYIPRYEGWVGEALKIIRAEPKDNADVHKEWQKFFQYSSEAYSRSQVKAKKLTAWEKIKNAWPGLDSTPPVTATPSHHVRTSI